MWRASVLWDMAKIAGPKLTRFEPIPVVVVKRILEGKKGRASNPAKRGNPGKFLAPKPR